MADSYDDLLTLLDYGVRLSAFEGEMMMRVPTSGAVTIQSGKNRPIELSGSYGVHPVPYHLWHHQKEMTVSFTRGAYHYRHTIQLQ